MDYRFLLAVTMSSESEKSIGDAMKDALDPEKASFFGFGVHPAFYTALITSAILILFAVIVRIFVIPKFKIIPSKFQCVLEKICEFFDGMVKGSYPNGNLLLGGYIFSMGLFIAVSTVVELVGLRPAMSNLNCCIAISLSTFSLIMFNSIRAKGALKGAVLGLKDFTVPISMSFRLFGAILSGFMVSELVYFNLATSIVLPVIIGVVFTLFHAVIQTYVFTMLSTLFISENGETDEKYLRKKLKRKNQKAARLAASAK